MASATDLFTRTAATLGGDWVDNVAGLQCVATNAQPDGATSTFQSAHYTGALSGAITWTADQYSEAIIDTFTVECAVCVRMHASADTYYFFRCHTAFTRIEKYVAGAETVLSSDSAIALVAGNTIRIEVTTSGGNAVLRAKYNGAYITALDITDSSSPIASGSPGIQIRGASCASFASWTGADIGGAAGIALAPYYYRSLLGRQP